MKKLFVLIGILFLFACEKDTLKCYRCDVGLVTTTSGGVKYNTFKYTFCDKTEAEIKEFEKTGTYNDGVVSSTTKCYPQ